MPRQSRRSLMARVFPRSAALTAGGTLLLPLVLAFMLAAAPDARAQSPSEQDKKRALFESIEWTDGPATGRLGRVASLSVPAGCRFTEEKGAKVFMEISENPPSGGEAGLLLCETAPEGNPAAAERWFVIFDYDPSGYVKDDERATLDAGKILSTLQEGQSAGNKERRKRGWDELTLDGWVRPPYYDQTTHNLTWATRVLSPGDTAVNHSVRLLGRGGVLKADLVIGPGGFELALPTFDQLIAGTSFVPDQRYSEWRDGDKVAAYGLTALVAGGAGAAAVKLGLFGKLGKLIAAMFAVAGKAIAVAVVGVAAWARSLFRRKKASHDVPTTG